ncbi:hypothetical protein BKA62DRAFT_163155 [Auriculariales sp. MPI-PUGE-AT-0066]|nr:hypothetical protein BKA62DRAFT_163155 [Auriculariales sp. MPI-PUGE-AT-0066]
MSNTALPLRIAIIGAGPAGLALATTLVASKTSTHRITVCEGATVIRDIGSGITISGRSFAIARAIGVEEAFNAIDQYKGQPNDVVTLYRKADEPVGHTLTYTNYGRGVSFHRAQFREAFASHVEKFEQVEIKYGKRLVNVVRVQGGYCLTFADNTSTVADIVIGADGYKSPTRHAMLRFAAQDLEQPELNELAPAVFSGQYTYRATIPVEKFREGWAKVAGPEAGEHRVFDEKIIYCGKGNHIPTYLIANRTLVNTLLFTWDYTLQGKVLPDEEHVKPDVDTKHLLSELEGWEPEVRYVVESMGKATLWAINLVKPLPFFAHAGIAILGDAAHAMPPHLANGGNQAIEDAYILGTVLNAPGVTRENVHLALQAYSATRMPRAQAVAAATIKFGLLSDWLYTFPGESNHSEDEARNTEEMDKIMGWVPKGDPEEEVKLALEMFAEAIAAIEFVSA